MEALSAGVALVFGLTYQALSVVLNIWIVSSMVGILVGVQIVKGLYAKKENLSVPPILLNHDAVVRELEKILPVGVAKGWFLRNVVGGLRLWNHRAPLVSQKVTSAAAGKKSHRWNILASASKVELLPQEIAWSVADAKELFSWSPDIRPPVTVLQSSTHNTAISSTSAPELQKDDITWVLPAPAMDLERTAVQTALSVLKTASLGYIPLLVERRKTPTVVNMKRQWRVHSADGFSYVFCQPSTPEALGYYWICYWFTATPTEETSSFAAIITLPVPGRGDEVARVMATQLSALSQHLAEKKAGLYQPVSKGAALVKYLSPTKPLTTQTGGAPPNRSLMSELQHSRGGGSGSADMSRRGNGRVPQQVPVDARSTAVEEADGVPGGGVPGGGVPGGVVQEQAARSTAPARHRFSDHAAQVVQRHIAAALARDGEDGWALHTINKGITILKRPPGPNDPPLNCVKGTGIIDVPPDFIFRFILNRENATKLDPIVEGRYEGRKQASPTACELVEELDPCTRINHLIYHPVRPTTARDFVCLTIVSRVDAQTRTYTATSVSHANCPENKSFVRGEVKVGGYVIRDNPDNPQQSAIVSYVTQVDLKGRVPSFVVNKVTSMQPMRVEKLRELVEAEYGRALQDPAVMDAIEDMPIPPPPNLNVEPEQEPPSPPDVPSVPTSPPDIVSAEKVAMEEGLSEVPDHKESGVNHTQPVAPTGDRLDNAMKTYTPEESLNESEGENGTGVPTLLSIGDNPVFGNIPWKYEQGTPTSVESLTRSETPYSLPIRDNNVDFKTLGNQVAACVLEEVFNVSSVDVKDPSTFTYGQKGWIYQSFDRDVVMLRKKAADSPFDCFVGKGIIPLPPEVVFQHIRNPTLRFSYDNMLKEIDFIRRIEEDLYILHLVHETTHCLMKQARDFCLLVSERVMPNQLMLVGTSVDVADCPVSPNLKRGKVLTSGWVLEPVQTARGKTHTLVTYLLQLDVGGAPAPLLNHISKRQPLAVAYLREYLAGSGRTAVQTAASPSTQRARTSPSV